jgi:hypothetical protein
MRSFRLLAVAVLAVVLFFAPYGFGLAQANSVPYQDLEQNGVPVTTLQVGGGSTFTIDVWIRGISSGDGLVGFDLDVTWDPTMMTLESYMEAANTLNWEAWHVSTGSQPYDHIEFYAVCMYAGCPAGSEITGGVMPLTLTFRCLAQGSSPVTADAYLSLVSGSVNPPDFVLTCNQYAEAVGGAVYDINKTALLSSWLATIGIVGCISTIAVVAKKRRP